MAIRTENLFSCSQEHLFAELKRITLKLDLLVVQMREGNTRIGRDESHGLYIPDEAFGDFNSKISFGSRSPDRCDGDTREIEKELDILEKEISAKKEQSLESGISLKLEELTRLFNLLPFEVDTILLCLLPELDAKYQRVFAYLQDDITRKTPSVELILNLLCTTFEDFIKQREVFSSRSPLFKYHLIALSEAQSSQFSLLTKSLKIEERIISFLMGTNKFDEKLSTVSNLTRPEVKLTDLVFPTDLCSHLSSLAKVTRDKEIIFCFQGGYGTGKHVTAEAFCSESGIPLLTLEIGKLLKADDQTDALLPFIFREGRLQGAALYFESFDQWSSGEKITELYNSHLMTELRDYPGWLFLAGENDFRLGNNCFSKPVINVEFPSPSFPERKKIWEKYWGKDSNVPDGLNFTEVAGAFRMTGGEIRDVIAAAKNLAVSNNPANVEISAQDVYAACRKKFRGALNTLAHKVKTVYTWNDIVLPKDQLDQLHEICSYMKHYNTVYGDWGFGRRISLGKGLNVLFSGPSGTGKTMSAEILANELKLDLYKIDLSTIVSKYIGETEKNLDRIFREGQTSNAILFFDEADAIFGKRSEVRDSHDRYANIEVAYLLQKMEEYDGIVILATNLRKNMDEAFARRMHFVLEFPIPEEPSRYRIWQSIFPSEAPLNGSVDLAFMAHQFKITGGNIKNIALGAAFLAADNSGTITMEHLIRATKREYQKTGKLCTEGDFGGYFELIKG